MPVIALAALAAALVLGALDPYDVNIPGAKRDEMVYVPGVVMSDGIPTRIREVRSTAKIEELFTFFYHHFRELGLFIPPEQEQPHMAQGFILTGVDTNSLTTYTVILQPLSDGSTTVVLGSALPAMRDENQAGNDPFPVFPGAQDALRTRAEGHSNITYQVSAKPEEVWTFYETTLAKAGYVKEKERGHYRAQGKELSVSIRGMANGQTGVIVQLNDRPLAAAPTPQTPTQTK